MSSALTPGFVPAWGVVFVVASAVTIVLHLFGARGGAVPGVEFVPSGAGLYSRIWVLDSVAHLFGGVAVAAFLVPFAQYVPVGTAWRAACVVAVTFAVGVLWEVYEFLFWGEVHNSGGLRRYVEDTQADVFVVTLGAAGVAFAFFVA